MRDLKDKLARRSQASTTRQSPRKCVRFWQLDWSESERETELSTNIRSLYGLGKRAFPVRRFPPILVFDDGFQCNAGQTALGETVNSLLYSQTRGVSKREL